MNIGIVGLYIHWAQIVGMPGNPGCLFKDTVQRQQRPESAIGTTFPQSENAPRWTERSPLRMKCSA